MRSEAIKQAFDMVLGVPLFFVCAPLMLFVAAMIRCTSGGPVFFRQPRPGLHGKIFYIVKFRTMLDSCDQNGRPLPDGERMTALGRFLRTTSLDELPELFNVLKGDMSLVGPRPLLTRYMPYFTPTERVRFTLKPGITGWAQVHGRNESSWEQRFENDIWYVENHSLGLDIKILAMTVKNGFIGKGVVLDARSIMLNLDEERASFFDEAPVGCQACSHVHAEVCPEVSKPEGSVRSLRQAQDRLR
jgi:lipopolysaccharide/colanic/teichoic acid biosynthesis glycosyltransferase